VAASTTRYADDHITVIQRLFRAMRADPRLPSKQAHLLIWARDLTRVPSVLEHLHDVDYDLSTMMMVGSGDAVDRTTSDARAVRAVLERAEARVEKRNAARARDIVSTSVDDKRTARVAAMVAWHIGEGEGERWPDDVYVRKGNTDPIQIALLTDMHALRTTNNAAEREALLSHDPGFFETPHVAKARRFVEMANGTVPKGSDRRKMVVRGESSIIGKWLKNTRQTHGRQKLDADAVRILDASLPGWCPAVAPREKAEALDIQIKRLHEHWPRETHLPTKNKSVTYRGDDGTEYTLKGTFVNHIKTALRAHLAGVGTSHKAIAWKDAERLDDLWGIATLMGSTHARTALTYLGVADLTSHVQRMATAHPTNLIGSGEGRLSQRDAASRVFRDLHEHGRPWPRSKRLPTQKNPSVAYGGPGTGAITHTWVNDTQKAVRRACLGRSPSSTQRITYGDAWRLHETFEGGIAWFVNDEEGFCTKAEEHIGLEAGSFVEWLRAMASNPKHARARMPWKGEAVFGGGNGGGGGAEEEGEGSDDEDEEEMEEVGGGERDEDMEVEAGGDEEQEDESLDWGAMDEIDDDTTSGVEDDRSSEYSCSRDQKHARLPNKKRRREEE
jgi:hypothetical protein